MQWLVERLEEFCWGFIGSVFCLGLHLILAMGESFEDTSRPMEKVGVASFYILIVVFLLTAWLR